MIEQELRNKLWEKASKEFETFKVELLKESKEALFDSAYKITTMNDFTDMCDPNCGCLSLDEVKALLKEKYPVYTMYSFYQKTDAGGISDLYEAIWYDLSELISQNKDKQKLNKTTNFER